MNAGRRTLTASSWAATSRTALIALPMHDLRSALVVLAVQFFLFRLFDVIKPPPGRRLEKLHGGWGIVLDDVFAGIYANLVGQAIIRWFLV